MAIENRLNVRLQHAVIGDGTTISSVPERGEVVFNSKLDNCKVGKGNLTYTQLPFLIPERKVLYKIPTASTNLESYLLTEILYNNTERFSIDEYNHIVIADINNVINYTWFLNGVNIYSVCSANPNGDVDSLYSYLRANPYKPLKITFIKQVGDALLGLFQTTGSSASTNWINNYLSCINYNYIVYEYPDNTDSVSGIALLMGQPYTISPSSFQSIQITCIDPINNKFLIE